MQLMETTNGGSTSAHELADIKKMLSRTKKELLETKQQLIAKEEEIDCVKEKHDRRLVRMKNLRDTHELVLEQIKTYDSGTRYINCCCCYCCCYCLSPVVLLQVTRIN